MPVPPRKPRKPRRNDLDFILEGDIDIPVKPAAKAPAKAPAQAPAQAPAKPAIKASSKPVSQTAGRETQSLGGAVVPRTKKAQQAMAAWSGVQANVKRDDYMQGVVSAHRQKTGSASKFLSMDLMFIGLPMPSLTMEYLFQMDVFPLSNFLQVSGPPSSCKTGLLVEFMRWFCLAGGGGHFQDAELKLSESWVRSILANDEFFSRIPIDRPQSMNEWQQNFNFYLQVHKKHMTGTKDDPGPGRVIPICLGLDSLVARSTDEVHEKITSEGSAGRGHPVDTMSITRFFKAKLADIEGWPFTVVVINHTMPKMDGDGPWDTREPGGEFVKFQQTYHIGCNKAGELSTAKFKGKTVALNCKKNGYGEGDRRARSRVLWRYEDVEGESDPRQVTWWDWNWSICDLLVHLKDWKQPMLAQRLRDSGVVLEAKSPDADVEPLAQCKALGMGKNDWLSYSEVGAMLHANEEVRNKIRRALAIRRRPVLDGVYYQQGGDK